MKALSLTQPWAATMIGSLLEDLASGLPFETVCARFAEKMHPLQYQRPQAPPAAGNVAQAEKIVERLKSAGALERRFAKLSDIKALWRPRRAAGAPEAPRPGGVFSHLETKERAPARAQDLDAPTTTMTWEKFARTVLPDAEAIECLVPAHGAFLAFVTAAHPDAPPILQWDFDDARNPVSWYLYVNGSAAADWNLPARLYHPVTAIATSPAKWNEARRLDHHGDSVAFLLDGARDVRHRAGGGFFPETLRSEYHAVRATMEAYAKRAEIAGRDEAEACGLALQKAARDSWGQTFRVSSKGLRVLYRLDRWD